MDYPFVFCVDDDDEDVQLLQDAIKTIGHSPVYKRANDGEHALIQLREMHHQGNLPSLIVMDINMPCTNGREALQAIQADSALRHIPVVIYTTSSSPTDQLFCSYHQVPLFTKPSSFTEIKNVAKAIMLHCKRQPDTARIFAA